MGILERTLTIKRIPTVLSNYQEEQEGDASSNALIGCGRNCLGKCCLPGFRFIISKFCSTLTLRKAALLCSCQPQVFPLNCSSSYAFCMLLGNIISVSKLPLYAYKRDGEGSDDEPAYRHEITPPLSFLVQLLLGQWEDRAIRGLFRYDVTLCETKVIPGRSGFIAQLNEGRHLKKRATEFRIDQVLQSFDDRKFNFTKVGQEEALLRFEPENDQMSQYPSSSVSELDSPNIVVINVSPIEYGHVLLIPRVLDKLPQRIDHVSFLIALSMAKEAADPFFRVGYNSLGAFATINHLHFQAYYIQVLFAVEKALIKRLSESKAEPNNGVIVSQLLKYPVRGLVFEGGNTYVTWTRIKKSDTGTDPTRGNTVQDMSDAVASTCVFLQNNNIPFNVLISGFGEKIYLFPQCYAEKQALGQVSQEILATQVNPAVWEISGHIVLKRREDYEKATEEYTWRLLAEVSLSEERFQAVVAQVLEAIGFQQADMNAVIYRNEEKQKNLNLFECPATTANIKHKAL